MPAIDSLDLKEAIDFALGEAKRTGAAHYVAMDRDDGIERILVLDEPVAITCPDILAAGLLAIVNAIEDPGKAHAQ